MEKVIYDEKNGLWYELQGDYYIPCLKLPEEEQQPIGVWQYPKELPPLTPTVPQLYGTDGTHKKCGANKKEK